MCSSAIHSRACGGHLCGVWASSELTALFCLFSWCPCHVTTVGTVRSTQHISILTADGKCGWNGPTQIQLRTQALLAALLFSRTQRHGAGCEWVGELRQMAVAELRSGHRSLVSSAIYFLLFLTSSRRPFIILPLALTISGLWHLPAHIDYWNCTSPMFNGSLFYCDQAVHTRTYHSFVLSVYTPVVMSVSISLCRLYCHILPELSSFPTTETPHLPNDSFPLSPSICGFLSWGNMGGGVELQYCAFMTGLLCLA